MKASSSSRRSSKVLRFDKRARSGFFLCYSSSARSIGAHYHVPPSVILAVASLETRYGTDTSQVIQTCFNLFHIKQWTLNDPICCKPVIEQIPEPVLMDACFRRYERPEESILDFCRLMQTERYRHLPETLAGWDYVSWVFGIHEAG